MEQITLRIPVRTLAEIERDARDAGRSRSEHMRDILESHEDTPRDAPDPERVQELEAEIAALEQDLEHARARQDELREMLKAANRRREETQALVEYVEQQDRSVVERLKSWFR